MIGFYLKECGKSLPATGITISDNRAVGGGSKSDTWIQLSVDLFGWPIARPAITEAGALGSAIMAGVGSGIFPDCPSGVQAMVRLEKTFVPDPPRQERYRARFEEYRQLYALLKGSLKAFHRADHLGAA